MHPTKINRLTDIMGEQAQLALEQEWDHIFNHDCPDDFNFREFRYQNSDRWMQLNGDIIDMKDMTDRHLSNSIAMLERSDHDYSDCPSYHGLIKEQSQRTKAKQCAS